MNDREIIMTIEDLLVKTHSLEVKLKSIEGSNANVTQKVDVIEGEMQSLSNRVSALENGEQTA